MAGRLRQLSLSGTGLKASDNPGAIVNDLDSGNLMESVDLGGGNYQWQVYQGSASRLAQTNTAGGGLSNDPFGVVYWDQDVGPLITENNGLENRWIDAPLPTDSTLMFPRLGVTAPSGNRCIMVPRLDGTLAFSGSVATAVGWLMLIPFRVPLYDTTGGIMSVTYQWVAPGSAGSKGQLAIYDSEYYGWPGTQVAASGQIAEDVGTGATWNLTGSGYTAPRGRLLWLGYLKVAGNCATATRADSNGPGLLGAQISAAGTIQKFDALGVNGAYAAVPSRVCQTGNIPATIDQLSVAQVPQFQVSFN